MDPLQHSDTRGTIENIVRAIPGFKGYFEREDRRESDHLARTSLEQKLQTVKQYLDRHLAVLVDQGHLETLAPGERLKSRIDGLQNSIRSSVRGYSGFFDYVQTGRDELDEVLALDLELVKAAESIEEAAKLLASERTASQEKLDQLSATIDELSTQFSKRSQILSGLSS